MSGKRPIASNSSTLPGNSGGVLLSQAHQLSGRVFARVLREHGIAELNPAQGRIVFALWNTDGITQTELAARTKLDKSGLALTLAKLEESGHIERRRGGSDARVARVFLTERNKAMHTAYREASQEMISIYYRGFGKDRIEKFERSLQDIIANLELAESGRNASVRE